MKKEFELWHFVHDRLIRDENVMLLVVAESSGSSPGRAGYKMAVAADGELCGSIGGGVMEVNLVEEGRNLLSEPGATATGLREQIHQKNSPDASGMICSGRQTVIVRKLTHTDVGAVDQVISAIKDRSGKRFRLTNEDFRIDDDKDRPNIEFNRIGSLEYAYSERLDSTSDLYIIGGGHCSLALSEMMSKLAFRISIFDDRPELNTLLKNAFAHEITVIKSYENIHDHIPDGENVYVVVMTLGYVFDAVVIRKLVTKDVRYFGVLGSKAKMATLLRELKNEGIDPGRLGRIRTPIGIPINSRTPEEIAVSIAAEIIAVKNRAEPTSPHSRKAIRNT